MNVISRDRSEKAEPVWDEVGIHGCDFRPHFDGDLVNLFTTIYPLESKSQTERLFRRIGLEIADWVLKHQTRFGVHDRYQIIVGWPLDVRPTGRQVVKTGGDLAILQGLIENPELIQVRSGWSKDVFPETNA